MKITKIAVTLLALLFLQGCLTYEAVSFRVKFDDVSNIKQIVMDYYNLASSDSTLDKQDEDFMDLLDIIQDDAFLLDNLEEGIYVKKRGLYEENGKLNARIQGVFRDLSVDDQVLKIKDNERVLLITEDEENLRIETDGRLIRTEENVMIVWPFEQKEIFWKIYNTPEEKFYSLISQYRDWRKSS